MVARLILIAFIAVMAGCQTPKGGFCTVAKPLHPSKATIQAMSDKEVADMLAYLERGRRLCDWQQ